LARPDALHGMLDIDAAQAGLRLRGIAVVDLALDRFAELGVAEVRLAVRGDAAPVRAQLAGRAGPPGWRINAAGPGAGTALADTALAGTALADAALADADTVIFADAARVWLDGPQPALGRLVAALGPEIDGVVLVHRSFQVHADVGLGDYFIDPLGLPRRRAESEIAPYVDTGVLLARPTLLAGVAGRAAGIDRAIAAGRMRAVVHDGLWFRLGTPADLDEAEQALAAMVTGPTT